MGIAKLKKNFRVYVMLFYVSVMGTLYLYSRDYGNDFLLQPRVIISILSYLIIYYFGILKEKKWAKNLVKISVWLHIIALIVFLLVNIIIMLTGAFI
ncbi:hypothetical protein ACK1LH_04260 [Metabacillus indicus]|uniref:hypothetical protein n=1 Tax=Metabacillus indicus TaxID=246786 RepID=UPI00398422A0